MSKRKKAFAGAFGMFVAALLFIYAVHVHETGRPWLVAEQPKS